MLSSELKSKINKLWDKFWSRGLSNPIVAIEQISFLLFMRRLEEVDNETKEQAKKNNTTYTTLFRKQQRDANGNAVLKKGKPVYEHVDQYRWSSFSELDKEEMLRLVAEEVFPFIKTINDPSQPYSKYMANAQFSIRNASLLEEAVQEINEIYKEIQKQKDEGQQFQDTQGDVYEYLLSEMSQSGKNGQFRTPRHLIQFLAEIIDPDVGDKICDPACGTSGFLLGAYQHILTKHSSEDEITEDENGLKRFKKYGGDLLKPKEREVLNTKTFYGFDIDETMVRIGLMNLMLHGIKVPQIEYTDTLSKDYDQKHKDGEYTVVMANPPFTGRIDKGGMSDQLRINGTQSELLFLVRISKMLKKKGRAAVIIPEGVLFGGGKAPKMTREILLKDNRVEAVISLPSGVFKPYTGVKTAVLVFTKVQDKSETYNTEKVWFYELANDGYSLDDNRRKLAENPLPIARDTYKNKDKSKTTDRKNHFFVPIDEIEKNGFDLSYNRYREIEYEEQEYEPPQEILKALLTLEDEIRLDMEELKDLIG